MLRAIGDLERIGDHSENIVYSAKEMYDKGIMFSEEAQSDFAVLQTAINDIVRLTEDAFVTENALIAKEVEPLEQVIDVLVRQARDRHIARMQRGDCSIEQGFVWNDILVNVERISDHCSNLAIGLIQSPHGSMESHSYLLAERSEDNQEFVEAFTKYSEKYKL